MADSTLNQFVSRGTNAERLAFTPSPPTPASGNDQGYFFYETDTGDTYAWDGMAWDQVNTAAAPGASLTNEIMPSGRLTLTSNTPVMNADATAQSSVYYTPYKGNVVPIYDGAAWAQHTFAQLTMSLDTSNQLSGNLYDLFIWNDSGTIKIGAGPAWSSGTARGTGAGTTELERKDGIWTNKVSITLKNGAGAGTAGIAANKATYVGTVYCTANGQTGMAFAPTAAAGGTNNILGLFNAYHRVRIRGLSRDNTASWTLNSTTLRAMDNSNSNRVSWIDGLQESWVDAAVSVFAGVTGTASWAGLGLDSITVADRLAQTSSVAAGHTPHVAHAYAPQLGFHYVQALEASSGSTTFNGSRTSPTGQLQMLLLSLDM